ncbi:MAG: glutaminase A [Planifilum sp.]|jgi:glutaminase
MQRLLESLVEKHRPAAREGKLAEYIPELAKQDSRLLGMAVVDPEGKMHTAGAYRDRFTLQSISKLIALMIALMDHGEEKVFSKVGMEPTGDPFHSIYKLEIAREAKPLNPMINAGAIAVSSLIQGGSVEERVERILHLVREMADNPGIDINRSVYQSERDTADRNRALAYFLKGSGVIDDVEETLDVYFRQCSICVDCRDLARMGLCLAQNGISLRGKRVIPGDIARLAKTFMVTCGMYNASGEFAIRVGIPAKSGVSGGIMALVPGRMGIGVFGPALDKKGNSITGVRLLEDFSKKLGLSIF